MIVVLSWSISQYVCRPRFSVFLSTPLYVRFPLFLFQRALEGMLVLTGEVDNVVHFGLRDLVRVYATDSDAFAVNMQHDLRGFFAVLVEEPLQHVDDELHRRV